MHSFFAILYVFLGALCAWMAGDATYRKMWAWAATGIVLMLVCIAIVAFHVGIITVEGNHG